jgi:hypothetical protein
VLLYVTMHYCMRYCLLHKGAATSVQQNRRHHHSLCAQRMQVSMDEMGWGAVQFCTCNFIFGLSSLLHKRLDKRQRQTLPYFPYMGSVLGSIIYMCLYFHNFATRRMGIIPMFLAVTFFNFPRSQKATAAAV